MKNTKIVFVIAGALVLSVLLFYAPGKVSSIPKKEEPLDKNQKIDFAIDMVKSGTNPMEGISILKEILKTDSLNEKALFFLGVFSIQSGQFDKAEKRFLTLLQTDSLNINALYNLAFVYEQQSAFDEAGVLYNS